MKFHSENHLDNAGGYRTLMFYGSAKLCHIFNINVKKNGDVNFLLLKIISLIILITKRS